MFIARLQGLLIAAIVIAGLPSAQTTAGQKETKKPVTQTNPKTAGEVYRQVSPNDGIHFYSRASSVELLPDPNAKPFEGNLHEEGFECGVVGADGKEIVIALVSTTIDHGRIQTKDFGVLKLETGSNMAGKLLATESQIKKLRALQQASGSGTTSSIPASANPKAATTTPQKKPQPEPYWIDPATHLTWAAEDNGQPVTWDQAKTFCANLTTAGFRWTLPTIEQLETIYDPSKLVVRKDSIDLPIKGGRIKVTYNGAWSSSAAEERYGPGEAYGIQYFPWARVIQRMSVTYRALCVRRAGE
jgi:hypothetical protein